MEKIANLYFKGLNIGFEISNKGADRKIGALFSKDDYPWTYIGMWFHLWWISFWVYFSRNEEVI